MTFNLTDPANHPANYPLTGERIERVIEALESSLSYRNGSSMDHFIADAVKGLRELRESREAKGDPLALEEMTACKAYDLLMEQAIPDNSFTNEELEAMAHGNNPQANAYRELLAFRRNSPVTPDGWVMVPLIAFPSQWAAGQKAFESAGINKVDAVYKAMVAAAPKEVG